MVEAASINIQNPYSDEDFFTIGRILAERYSTCLKTNTASLIVTDDKKILSWGVNMCCPQGQLYGLPVSECPRMEATTGTSYALCMPIHAEIVACLNAFGISTADRKNLWHFAGFTRQLREYEGFFKSKGAVLYLVGHYWACDECIDFARSVGIEEIKFDNLSGGVTREKYREQGISQVGEKALDVSGSILSGIVTVRIAPSKLDDFCRRNRIKKRRVSLLPTQNDVFVVTVRNGKEVEGVSRFSEDPDVIEARTIYLS